MSKNILCPKCNKLFDEKEHLKYGVRLDLKFFRAFFNELILPWKSGSESIYDSNIIVCPSCGKEFKAKDYKHFGFLGAKAFHKAIIAFIVVFIALPLLFILFRFFL